MNTKFSLKGVFIAIIAFFKNFYKKCEEKGLKGKKFFIELLVILLAVVNIITGLVLKNKVPIITGFIILAFCIYIIRMIIKGKKKCDCECKGETEVKKQDTNNISPTPVTPTEAKPAKKKRKSKKKKTEVKEEKRE